MQQECPILSIHSKALTLGFFLCLAEGSTLLDWLKAIRANFSCKAFLVVL